MSAEMLWFDGPVRRIAVFRALYLGDLLLAVPALRALRAGYPAAEITLIGLPWAAPFVRRIGRYVDRFVEFAGHPGIAEVPVVPARTACFLIEQRAYAYDLAIQMHGSGRTSNAVVLALGARATVGYYDGAPSPGLTRGAPYPDDEPEVRRNLGLALLAGCPDRGTELEFSPTAEDHADAAALLRPLAGLPRPWIGIHAGASVQSRRWPAEHFAAVADVLAQEHGARIVLTGGPGEVRLAEAVAGRMATGPLNVAGRTTVGGLAALIARLDLFISGDTGPAHVAAAVDTPSVTIFGPGDPRRWAHLDRARHPIVRQPVECSPCPHHECPIDHRCLRRLAPAAVLALADQLLGKGAVACSA